MKRPWKQEGMGFLLTVGLMDDRPICVTFSFAVISEKRICFWEATSQLVDYVVVENWLKEKFPGVRRTNAMNFHNAF